MKDEDLETLKRELVYDPVERARETDPHAVGLWLRGLREFHRLQVRDYIVRNSGADPSSHMYPRSGDYLMVVTGVTEDLSALARLCERFGEVRRTVDELRIIEVAVTNNSFQEGPLEKLTDPANPAFYELNKRELESIDLERARRAVTRLAPVEPKLYRKDIARRIDARSSRSPCTNWTSSPVSARGSLDGRTRHRTFPPSSRRARTR